MEMPGYSLNSQPSLSIAGGVGFYIREDQLFTIRPDLALLTLNERQNDFEALWVKIQMDLNIT